MDRQNGLFASKAQPKSRERRDVLAQLALGSMAAIASGGAGPVRAADLGGSKVSGNDNGVGNDNGSGRGSHGGTGGGTGLRAWGDYIDMMRPAGDLIEQTWDPHSDQMRAELYRQLVMNAAQAYIWYFQSSPDHPDWMPFENSIFLLQPNPDATYHLAPVSGAGVYRISGYRGTNPVMGFAVGRGMFGTEEPKPGFNNYDADSLTLGEDGWFDVVFSAERPGDWTGDWRHLDPDAESILVRQFAYDWGKDVEARFAIERLDRAPLKPRLTTEQIAQKLEAVLGGFVNRFSRITLGYQRHVESQIGLNTMELSGFEDLGNSGEWPQKYWRCIYDLQPGEALVLETELPNPCKYWNVQINDALWNQVEFGYRQSSLNAYQARVDSDGRFRAVLTLEDPGVPNWLDSGGHTRGMLVGRWHGAGSYPMPTMKKVPVAAVRQHLPQDTPTVTAAERDKTLRARNIGLQMRRRW
jgi:hypothetical protein